MALTVEFDICRVVVQHEDHHVDLALSSNVAVAELIPLIADIVVASSQQSSPVDWELVRVDGCPLSSKQSLRDNGVRNGQLLLLTCVSPPSGSSPSDDGIATIAASLATPRWTPAAARFVTPLGSVACSGLAGYALIRSGGHTAAFIAAVLSGLALVGVIVYGRLGDTSPADIPLGVAATVCAAVAGYLLVPGNLAAPKLLLAATSTVTVAVLAACCTPSGTGVFAAITSAAAVSAVGAFACVFMPTSVSGAGSVITATAATTLLVAARLAIWMSRLPVPRLPDAPHVGDADCDITSAGRRAHVITTGLVCGAAASAALGAALSSFGGQLRGVLLAAVIGVVLLTRAGIHVDLIQSCALIASGATCFGMLFVQAVHQHIQHAQWLSLAAAGVAVTALPLARPFSMSPLHRRGIELISYAALAAVAPLACWTFGVFGAVRSLV